MDGRMQAGNRETGSARGENSTGSGPVEGVDGFNEVVGLVDDNDIIADAETEGLARLVMEQRAVGHCDHVSSGDRGARGVVRAGGESRAELMRLFQVPKPLLEHPAQPQLTPGVVVGTPAHIRRDGGSCGCGGVGRQGDHSRALRSGRGEAVLPELLALVVDGFGAGERADARVDAEVLPRGKRHAADRLKRRNRRRRLRVEGATQRQ